SVISIVVQVNQNAVVKNSVMLPGAFFGSGVVLDYVIVAENINIADGVKLTGDIDHILLIDKNVNK
ncbi:glucose-1-phosphate adenylyltransferase, partial [Streptococcus suis]